VINYHQFVEATAKSIMKGAGVKEVEKQEVITYGVDVLISSLITYFVMILVSGILGVLPVTICIALTCAFLRSLSGGAHCKFFYGCFLLTITVFPLFGLALRHIPAMPQNMLGLLVVMVYVVSLYIVYQKAPVDTAEKPIVSEGQKQYLKKGSLVFVSIIFLLQLSFIRLGISEAVIIGLSIGLLWQSLQLTVVGKVVTSTVDFVLTYLKRKG